MTDVAARAPHGRNIALLSTGLAVAGSQQALIMAVGGLIGARMAPDARLATMPVTSMVLGLAIAAGPAAMLAHRLGRTRAFILGALIGVLAGLIAALAIVMANFLLFCFALVLGGISGAFGQQYRFAAADSVPADLKGRAVSWVMAGGIVAGFVGPAIAFYGRDLIFGARYAGSFLAIAGLAAVAAAVLSQTKLAGATPKVVGGTRRPFWHIVRSPEIFIPIFTGIVSYGMMNFVMVAAPLAMVIVCGHPEEAATFAIQWHIVSMYAPSFFTGAIIARVGARAVIGAGMVLIVACCIIALNGTSVLHFNVALILLGIGWNFGFIGSTALLAQSYRPEEAAQVQSINEQLVFGTMAIASISSGVLLQTLGWQAVNILAMPLATIAIALLAWGSWRAENAKSA
jgi:MFS family permease